MVYFVKISLLFDIMGQCYVYIEQRMQVMYLNPA